jgi:hypothetical protein
MYSHCRFYIEQHTGARGTDHPPFSNFLFANLFSIKFLYFFIISSLFSYFNLFVFNDRIIKVPYLNFWNFSGMDTCPSLIDIMEIRCNKCTRSEQGYDF